MIVVTVELKSAIHDDRSRLLGRLLITNDGTSKVSYKGNYDCVFYGGNGGTGKRGRVEDYARQAVSIWNLIRRACIAAGYTK